MKMTNKPCAYCGCADIPRTKGHVIPENMFPSDMDPRVRWPTVAECLKCKSIWEGADGHFRSIVVLASKFGNPNAEEKWCGPIVRSLDHPSGMKWFREMMGPVDVVETENGPQHRVSPAKGSHESCLWRAESSGAYAHTTGWGQRSRIRKFGQTSTCRNIRSRRHSGSDSKTSTSDRFFASTRTTICGTKTKNITRHGSSRSMNDARFLVLCRHMPAVSVKRRHERGRGRAVSVPGCSSRIITPNGSALRPPPYL